MSQLKGLKFTDAEAGPREREICSPVKNPDSTEQCEGSWPWAGCGLFAHQMCGTVWMRCMVILKFSPFLSCSEQQRCWACLSPISECKNATDLRHTDPPRPIACHSTLRQLTIHPRQKRWTTTKSHPFPGPGGFSDRIIPLRFRRTTSSLFQAPLPLPLPLGPVSLQAPSPPHHQPSLLSPARRQAEGELETWRELQQCCCSCDTWLLKRGRES